MSTPVISRRPSIRDVAKAAGVSHTTVSLILNGKMSGTSETRERVLTAVKKLDYQPDALFRHAVAQRNRVNQGDDAPRTSTKILALVMPTQVYSLTRSNDGYYSGVSAGACQAATEAGWNILLCPQELSATGIPAVIADGKVDGVLVEGLFSPEWIGLLAQQRPTALINTAHPSLDVTCVSANWERVGYQLVRHAWEKGHRNLAFFQHDHVSENLSSVMRGHVKALEAFDIPLLHPGLSRPRKVTPENTPLVVAAFVDEWMAASPRPTTIITTDHYAYGIMKELLRRGVRIPQEVSLLGRHGNFAAAQSSPSLTSYHYPVREIGHAATRLLIEAIVSGDFRPKHLMIDGEMHEGESIRNLNSPP